MLEQRQLQPLPGDTPARRAMLRHDMSGNATCMHLAQGVPQHTIKSDSRGTGLRFADAAPSLTCSLLVQTKRLEDIDLAKAPLLHHGLMLDPLLFWLRLHHRRGR